MQTVHNELLIASPYRCQHKPCQASRNEPGDSKQQQLQGFVYINTTNNRWKCFYLLLLLNQRLLKLSSSGNKTKCQMWKQKAVEWWHPESQLYVSCTNTHVDKDFWTTESTNLFVLAVSCLTVRIFLFYSCPLHFWALAFWLGLAEIFLNILNKFNIIK